MSAFGSTDKGETARVLGSCFERYALVLSRNCQPYSPLRRQAEVTLLQAKPSPPQALPVLPEPQDTLLSLSLQLLN